MADLASRTVWNFTKPNPRDAFVDTSRITQQLSTCAEPIKRRFQRGLIDILGEVLDVHVAVLVLVGGLLVGVIRAVRVG
jgi:hypothetical protein